MATLEKKRDDVGKIKNKDGGLIDCGVESKEKLEFLVISRLCVILI